MAWSDVVTALQAAIEAQDTSVKRVRTPDGLEIEYDWKTAREMLGYAQAKADQAAATPGTPTRRVHMVPVRG